MNRSRCGCHVVQVDTGRWTGTERKDRLCQVHTCVICYRTYRMNSIASSIFQLAVTSATSMQIFSSKFVQYQACIAKCEPSTCGCVVRECVACRKCTCVLCFTESQKQNSVGLQFVLQLWTTQYQYKGSTSGPTRALTGRPWPCTACGGQTVAYCLSAGVHA